MSIHLGSNRSQSRGKQGQVNLVATRPPLVCSCLPTWRAAARPQSGSVGRPALSWPAMAVLLEGQKLPIASKADSGKSVVFVKLTDSALRSLEEYFKHRVNYLRLPHFNHITAPHWRKISSNPINCFYHSSPNCAQSQISKWENFQQNLEILMFQHIAS